MPCLGRGIHASRNEKINLNHHISTALPFSLALEKPPSQTGSRKLLHRRSGIYSPGSKWAKQVLERRLISCEGFSGIPDPSIGSALSLNDLAGYASTLLWAGVFWFAYKSISQTTNNEPQGRECETCGGSGYVECFCTRWSDGDRQGCSSCGGSLQKVCHSCRGGGTAVPILGKVYIKDEKDYGM